MCLLAPYIATLATLMLASASVRADDVERREDQFKAAYLFNFVKFVEWPPGAPAESLTVCFFGGEGVHQALAIGIDQKRVGTRRLVARRLDVSSTADKCEMLYVDAASAARVSLPTGLPVLTVSDAPQFIANGGMIELFTENHRLRFLVNVANAHKGGLRISSDLLKLAAGVQREER
jgi:hypothetical protein